MSAFSPRLRSGVAKVCNASSAGRFSRSSYRVSVISSSGGGGGAVDVYVLSVEVVVWA